MSFLLDALRKSENQKQLGNAPTIHSTENLGKPPRRRLKPVVFVLILLPALLVLSWYVWQLFLSSSSIEHTRPVTRSMTEPFTESTAEVVTENEALPAIPQNLPPGNRVSAERTPVETFEPQSPVEESGRDIQASPKPSVEAIMIDQLSEVTEPEPDGPVVLEVEASQSQAEELQLPRTEAISYWQLPESIREEMPDLRISVLVFSEMPESRFIIMNGRRIVEGDEFLPGLVLVEIRRLGVIFSYKHYQFIVSR
jgi:general secretion pathway protein B